MNVHEVTEITLNQTVHCITQGNTLLQKKNNISHIATLNMDLAFQNASEVHVSQTSIGDMCASHVKLADGNELIMIVVYISPN